MYYKKIIFYPQSNEFKIYYKIIRKKKEYSNVSWFKIGWLRKLVHTIYKYKINIKFFLHYFNNHREVEIKNRTLLDIFKEG